MVLFIDGDGPDGHITLPTFCSLTSPGLAGYAASSPRVLECMGRVGGKSESSSKLTAMFVGVHATCDLYGDSL